MEDYKLLHEIKNKKEKTNTEKLLLHYHNILSEISCILVDESKLHIDEICAITDIRKTMHKTNIGKLEEL